MDKREKLIEEIETLLNQFNDLGKNSISNTKWKISQILQKNSYLNSVLTKNTNSEFEKEIILNDLIESNSIRESLLMILDALENEK